MSDMTKEQKRLLDRLEAIETVVAQGLVAFDERNEIIYRLVQTGWRQADITRRINAVRKAINAPEITPDAVGATVRRVARKHGQDQ